jgi:hypothetical protein
MSSPKGKTGAGEFLLYQNTKRKVCEPDHTRDAQKVINLFINLRHRKHDHEQARPFHLASELSQRTALTGNSARNRARKGERLFAEIPEAMKMTMTRFRVLAITAGLLLAVSEPSFAAKRSSDTKSAVKSQSRATEFKGSAIRPYSRDPYSYGRDDPYAPGVNWPGKW